MEKIVRYSGDKVALEIGFEEIFHSVYIEYTKEGEKTANMLRTFLEENGVEICMENMPSYKMLFCFPSFKMKEDLHVLVLKALSMIR